MAIGNSNTTETAKETIAPLLPPPPVQQEQKSENTTRKRILEMWEQPNLLNLETFSWLMNNESLCQLAPLQTPETRIMPVLVHTARSHFDERLAIRKSWGSVPIYKNWDVRLVFLLGDADPGTNPNDDQNQTQVEEEEEKLKVEQKTFGDIVMGSFVDKYRNLIYKHLMGYKWILNFCVNASFVTKIDDDMFIDVFSWLDWRINDLERLKAGSSVKIPDMYCATFVGAKAFRSGKWYASKKDWPDDSYPDYCSGCAYGTTVELIRKVYSVSNDVKFFWIDDVFVTGLLMDAAERKYKWKSEIRDIWENVTYHSRDYREMCDKAEWDSKRIFRVVVRVPRGKLLGSDMMSYYEWNKRGGRRR